MTDKGDQMANAGDGDKRTVATDALLTLGTIIDDTQKRDAIHLAVEPVIAGEDLAPGFYVAVTNGIATKAAPDRSDALGIVDPFIPRVVVKGERFWFVMLPRMVHSLRHVWTHPAFPDAEVAAATVEAERKVASEKWLRDFCDRADCPRYERLIQLITGQRDGEDDYEESVYIDGDRLHFSGADAHGDIPPEFWDHLEVVTGMKFRIRPDYFSCSC